MQNEVRSLLCFHDTLLLTPTFFHCCCIHTIFLVPFYGATAVPLSRVVVVVVLLWTSACGGSQWRMGLTFFKCFLFNEVLNGWKWKTVISMIMTKVKEKLNCTSDLCLMHDIWVQAGQQNGPIANLAIMAVAFGCRLRHFTTDNCMIS